MPNKTLSESSSPAPPKKSFSQYLIDTDIFPLPLLGKSIQYFGAKEVIVFFLGAAALYGYSLYKPLPYQKSPVAPAAPAAPTAPAEAKTIELHGTVRTLQNEPLTEFYVATMSDTVFPVSSADGTFAIQVPYKETYSLVVWDPQLSVHTFGNRMAAMVDSQYKLIQDLSGFPATKQ